MTSVILFLFYKCQTNLIKVDFLLIIHHYWREQNVLHVIKLMLRRDRDPTVRMISVCRVKEETWRFQSFYSKTLWLQQHDQKTGIKK